jgi:hypothetical protein
MTNATTRVLRDAVLLAAEQSGADGNGKDGLVGYLRWASRAQPAAFLTLLSKTLAINVTGQLDIAKEITYRTVEEVERDLEARGFPKEALKLFDLELTGLPAPEEERDGQNDDESIAIS